MTTATQAPAPPVQITRTARGIDAAVALLSGPDGNLEDVAMLLRRLATADLNAVSTVDPAARMQGLCAFIANRLREQFSDDIRSAPPAALGELVRDASKPCAAPTCSEDVLPWQGSTCGDPRCAGEVVRAFGGES